MYIYIHSCLLIDYVIIDNYNLTHILFYREFRSFSACESQWEKSRILWCSDKHKVWKKTIIFTVLLFILFNPISVNTLECLFRYIPHCIEPSVGVDRLFLAILTSAYHEEEVNKKKDNNNIYSKSLL